MRRGTQQGNEKQPSNHTARLALNLLFGSPGCQSNNAETTGPRWVLRGRMSRADTVKQRRRLGWTTEYYVHQANLVSNTTPATSRIRKPVKIEGQSHRSSTFQCHTVHGAPRSKIYNRHSGKPNTVCSLLTTR